MALKDIVLKLVIDGKESLVTLDKLDNKTGKLSKTVKGVAGSLGLAFGSAQVFGWMKDAISLAQRENEVIGKLKATLDSTGYSAGMTATELVDLAKNLEEINNFKFDDKEIIDAEGMLLTFKSINKEIFPEAIQLAMDLSVRFNQDLTTSVKQLGKALEDPERGITALRKAGVMFSDVQEKQIKGFIKSNDLMSAQKMILAELTTQVGGSAAASVDEFTAKWAKVTDALEDATIAAGRFFQGIGIGIFEVGNYIGSVIKTGSFAGGLLDYGNKKAQEQFNRYKGEIVSTYKQSNTIKSGLDFGDETKVKNAKDEATDYYKHLEQLEDDLWKARGDVLSDESIPMLGDYKSMRATGPEGGGMASGATLVAPFDKMLKETDIFANSMTITFDKIWSKLIEGGLEAADIMNALFSSILSQIGQILSNALFSSLTTGPGGGGDLGSTLFSLIPFLGDGGIVTKPTMAVIGESGPEAVVPLDRFNMGGREIRVVVEGALKGDTIYLANKRAAQIRKNNKS